MEQELFDPQYIEECILDSARGSAWLLGLLKQGLYAESYASLSSGDNHYTLVKKVLPNQFARLDIMFVNNEPVGSICVIEIYQGLYHMLGMYVKPSYRAKEYGKKLIPFSNGSVSDISLPSPAKFMMEHYMRDLFENKVSMTLEVMNYNAAAYRLYEKQFICSGESMNAFSLLSKEKIEKYSRLRSKSIGKWHPLDVENDTESYGVQWKHIPDYNNTSEWSITRVYFYSPIGDFLSVIGVVSIAGLIRIKAKTFVSIFKYGDVFGFLESARKKISLKRFTSK